jgi:hypothetical protein
MQERAVRGYPHCKRRKLAYGKQLGIELSTSKQLLFHLQLLMDIFQA